MCLSNCFKKFSFLTNYCIYIDGNNVAYSSFNKKNKPELNNILLTINTLIAELGFKRGNIHCICDPSLRYYIDKPNDYEMLIKEGVIIEAPKVADEMILSFALKHKFCFIISNDRFREYIEELPSKKWLEDRRIPFLIIEAEICLSPNIGFEKLQTLRKNSLEKVLFKHEITTLEIVNRLEKSEGELNLF